MGNEVSRPADDGALSPPSMGASVPPTPPYTPAGGARARSFTSRSASPTPPRRANSGGNVRSSASPGGDPKMDRSIQRMDKAIRRRVRGGITYNMKLLLRGAKGTGKTSLFQRLKGDPIPDAHVSTPQLQSATIRWNSRANSEENVKCEVWDVVDRGFLPSEADAVDVDASVAGTSAESMTTGGLPTATTEAAAAASASVTVNGAHSVAVVDASTVDVYHEAHGVIFLLDVTKWDTLEYVKQQLDAVPVHIPTLVLGNFRDCGAQRKIFKEDIQELLYGSADRPQSPQWRRPQELLYFECSLLNCYGLKSLHQYLGIPFLQLKLASLRQKVRLVEGDFAHLKHDLQANISDSRYVDYVEHIKATGSDIRTGRRASATTNAPSTPPGGQKPSEEPAAVRQSVNTPPSQSEGRKTRRTSGSGRNGGDVVIDGTAARTAAVVEGMPPLPMPVAGQEARKEELKTLTGLDAEDLPARANSAVLQAAPALKFEHQESVTSTSQVTVEDAADKAKAGSSSSGEAVAVPKTGVSKAGRARKTSVGEVVDLADFQVPKLPKSELDHFYSEDESDEEDAEDDEDVVVAGGLTGKKAASNVYHKQRFLDSDSDEDEEKRSPRGSKRNKAKASKTSSRQASDTETKAEAPSSATTAASAGPAPTSRNGVPSRPEPSSPGKGRSISSPRRASSLKQMGATTSTSPTTMTTTATGAVHTPAPPTTPPSSSGSLAHRGSSLKLTEKATWSSPASESCVASDKTAETKAETHVSGVGEATERESSRSTNPKDRELLRELSQHRKEQQSALSCSHEDAVEAQDEAQDGPRAASIAAQGQHRESEDGVLVHAGGNEPATSAEDDNVETHDALVSTVDDADAGIAATSNEMETFLSEEDANMAAQPVPVVMENPSAPAPVSDSTARRPEIQESDDDEPDARLGSASDLSSSSALQASLPLPSSTSSSSPPTPTPSPSLSVEPRPFPSLAAASTSTVVPTNDLEAFLNASDSDSDAGAGQASACIPATTSDDEDDAQAEARFASYSVNKKNKAERRRQQREELRQLNAALDKLPWEGEQKSPANSHAAVSAANDDVLAAIHKAQEEALRMLPSTPDDDAVSSVSSSRSRHKSKKTHKKKSKDKETPEDAVKDRKSRKSSRKAGSRSKSRRAGQSAEGDSA